MNVLRAFKIAVICMAVAGAMLTAPRAACNSAQETYAVFHCANRAYFEPVPAGFSPSDATGVFWQLGFGNLGINTGLGVTGTAFISKAFNGNDSGIFTVNLLDAAANFPVENFPPGSVCLGSNNWSNTGVDGCCDNPRSSGNINFDIAPGYTNSYTGFGPYVYAPDDQILNPYFGTFQNTGGFPGYFSLASMMDYPTAVLVRLPGDAWFALAAVTNMNRGNTGIGVNGPCSVTPGSNPAPCDLRQGFFSFGDVVNGNANAIPSEAGKMNAIPWQTVRPREVSGLDCSLTDCGAPTLPVQFQIDPIMIHSDERSVPSNNPTMATRNTSKPRDATRAGGVGVRDLKRRWGGMIRYTIEKATIDPLTNVDANGDIIYTSLVWVDDPNSANLMAPPLDPNTGNPTGPIMIPTSGTMNIPIPSCWRTRVDIGKVPDPVAASEVNCRVGKCGDLGLTIGQRARSGVTCFGNRDPLVSENIINGAVRTVKGRHTITWDTTAELTVQGFEIFAVTQRGPKLVGSVGCSECSSGAGASYETVVRPGDIRAGKITGFQIKMKGGSGAVADLPAR